MKPIRSAIVFVSVLAMLSIWGFIAVYRAGYVPNGLDVGIFAIIVISGTYVFVTHIRRYQAEKVGLPLSAFVAIGLKIYLMRNYHENEN
jgi:hypothetical protein